jgi:hypothetical protein
MAFTSILKPDNSVALGVATAVFVYTIYSKALPDTGTIHATDPGDVNIDLARKKAAWTAAAAVSGITLLTKDISVFTLGAAAIFALDMQTRHANASNNETGELVSQAPGYGNTLRSVS